MPKIPILPLPGELWVHVGPVVPDLFPQTLVRAVGSIWEARQKAVSDKCPVLLLSPMSNGGIFSARRSGGLLNARDVPHELMATADIVTTGFHTANGFVAGCLKNRDGALFKSFTIHEPGRTLWDWVREG